MYHNSIDKWRSPEKECVKEVTHHYDLLPETDARLNSGIFNKFEEKIKVIQTNSCFVKEKQAQLYNTNIQLEEKIRVLTITQSSFVREHKKTEIKINKLEKEIEQLNICYRNKEEESFKLLMDHRFCKLEERLNSVEADNRELRKIIDELRPTKSKYM